MYILILCVGINSWTGCAATYQTVFPNKEECFEALREVKTQEKGQLSTGEASSEFVAYCTRG